MGGCDCEDGNTTTEEAEETRYPNCVGKADLDKETTEHNREDDPAGARSGRCNTEGSCTIFCKVGRNRRYRRVKPLGWNGKLDVALDERNSHQPNSQPKQDALSQ